MASGLVGPELLTLFFETRSVPGTWNLPMKMAGRRCQPLLPSIFQELAEGGRNTGRLAEEEEISAS